MESTNKLDSSTEEVAMVKTDDPMESANNRNILDDDTGETDTVKTDCLPIKRLNLPNERESIIVSENMGNIGHGNLPVKMEIPEKIQNDTSDNMEITNSVIKYIGSEIPGSLPASSVDENNPVCPIKTDESDKHVPINVSEAAMMVKREIISNMEGFPMSRQNLLNEEEINTTSQTIEGSGHGTLPNMPMETSEIVRNYISGSNMEVKNPGLKITGPEMLENMSNISIDNRLIKTEVTNNYVPGTVGLPRSDYLVNLFGGTSARPIFYTQNLAVPANRTVRFGFPHVCGICNKAFREKGLLSKHIRIHTGEKPFPCEICDKRFRIRADLKIHMVVHNSERLFACEICKKTFKRKVHLRGHMLVHSSEKLYSCEKCCLSFARKHSMKRHMSRCKGKEAISIAEYKQNQSFVDVKMNQNNKDDAQPTLAPIDLSKPYVCGTCGFNFETKASLSFHMKIHSEDKPFFCEICNMSFTRKANLKRHQIVHTDERRYPCYICGQTFKLQSHINDHMLSHGQSKPFTCKFCGASYTKKVSFQNHLANCNNNAPKGHSSTLDHNVQNEQEVNSTSPSGLDILSHLASYRRLQNEQSIGSSFPSGLDIFNQLSSHRKLRNQRGFENNIPSGLDLFNQLTSHRTFQNEQDIESNIPSGLDIFNRLTSYRQVQNEQGVESNIPSGLDIFNHLTSLRKVQNEHKDDESIVPDEADSLDDETSHCKVPNEQKDTENSIPCESNSLDHTTSQCEVRNEPEVGQESIPCRSDILDHHRKLEMMVNNDTEEPVESESHSNEIKLSRNCSKLLSAVSKLNSRRKFIINSSDEDKTAETDNSLIYAKSQIDDPNSIAQSISDVYLTKQVLMENLFLE